MIERRKYPRVAEAVPCQVKAKGEFLTALTRNLSCGGALFTMRRSLPLMTRLSVAFALPSSVDGGAPRPIRCTGVVVRKEPATEPGRSRSYLTAIYFSRIRPTDRRRIARFVLERMLSQ